MLVGLCVKQSQLKRFGKYQFLVVGVLQKVNNAPVLLIKYPG